ALSGHQLSAIGHQLFRGSALETWEARNRSRRLVLSQSHIAAGSVRLSPARTRAPAPHGWLRPGAASSWPIGSKTPAPSDLPARLRVQDAFLQEAGVLLDRGQHAVQPRRATPYGGHLERLDGGLEFVPGLPVMKPLPQIVAFGEISQRPVEGFLSPADSRLDLAELRRRRPKRASVEQLASFAT